MTAGNTTNTFGASERSVVIGQLSGGTVQFTTAVHPETPPGPLSTVPFPRDPDYIDRTGILGSVEDKLRFSGARVALVGLGGVGKSQFAIEYAHRLRKASPSTWTIWLHASNASRFEESVRDTLDQLKIAGQSQQTANNYRLLRSWLQEAKHGNWLLIVDNADDATFLLEPPSGAATSARRLDYFPSCDHGAILFTSRIQNEMLRCVDLNNIIEVGPMNEQQAMALIRKKLGEKLSSEYDSDDIKKLANSLECIPLALAQAAAYIRQRAPKFSVQQYVEKVDELNKSTKLLDRNDINLRRDGDASHSVMLTWRVSFEHLRKFKQSAADLLSLMSFFDRQAIPEAPLRRRRLRSWTIDQAGVVSRGAFVDWKSVRDDEIADDERDATFDASYEQDAEAFDEDLVLLRNYSFVSLTEVKTDYKMHRLVQIATQDWLRSMGHLSRWTSQFIDNLSEAFPKKPKFQDWKSCRQLFAHSVRALEVDVAWHEGLLWHAYLLRHSGNFASAVGLSAQSAQVMLGRSVELHTKVLGHVHRYTLSNKQDLAYCMYKEAKYNDAESLGREVLEAIETALRNSRRNGAEEDAIITQGFDHSSRKDINVFAMDIKNDLALVYVKQDRLPEAENLQLEVLDAYKVAHGKEHSNTLVAMENLAMTLALQKRFTEAQRLGRKVLNLREKDPGPNHPMTLMSMYNLACMQLDQESVGEETEKLITQVVDGRRKLFGDDNPTTLWSLRSLGSLRLMQCRWQDAKEILDVCYTKGITICGPEHPHTLLSMQDLARANRHLERPDEAYNLMRPCLTAMVQVHGAEHSRTVTARKILERWEKEDADRQENIAQSTGPSDLCPQVAQPTGRSEQRAPGRPENRVFTSRIPTRIRRT